MTNDVARIMFTAEEIDKIVARLGKEMSEKYRGRKVCFLCVLKGSFIFCADLMRKMEYPIRLMFIQASSYKNSTVTSGDVDIQKLPESIEGYDVVVIEDILDTGTTLSNVMEYLKMQNPASLAICTLLEKPARLITNIKADFVGAVIPDEFVVGYGLDFAQDYRNLPYIGVLKPEIYN